VNDTGHKPNSTEEIFTSNKLCNRKKTVEMKIYLS